MKVPPHTTQSRQHTPQLWHYFTFLSAKSCDQRNLGINFQDITLTSYSLCPEVHAVTPLLSELFCCQLYVSVTIGNDTRLCSE